MTDQVVGDAVPDQAAGSLQRPGSDAVDQRAEVQTGRRPTGVLARLLRDRLAVASLLFLTLLVALATLAPFIAPYDPNRTAVGPRLGGFSREFWLGTDDLGRDVWSRLLYGTRVSLRFSLQVVAMAVVVAIPTGIYAGYKGGVVDNALMRVVDALASIPGLILALALVGLLGPSMNNATIAIAVVMCPGFIRLVRAQALAVREETFIEASRSLGTPQRRILVERLLPNSLSSLVVVASVALGTALVAESGLSLLGFGVQPPDASWGSMLGRGRTVLSQHPVQVFVPAIALAITTLAFNILGDGLADAMSEVHSRRGRKHPQQLGITAVANGSSAPTFERAAGQQPHPVDQSHPVDRSTSLTPLGSTADRSDGDDVLLRVDGLSVEFDADSGPVRVVDDIGFHVRRGEVLGIVGESGSGKSVTSLSILRLVPPPGRIAAGEIRFDSLDLLRLSAQGTRQIRGDRIAMVFQDPMTSLNPAFTVGDQLSEAVRIHRSVRRDVAHRRALELLEMVGIPDPKRQLRQYPHQFSGGMRQRVCLAIALACEPELLIADEPTTALDVTVQAQILDLLRSLQRETKMSMIFVTHDLGIVAELCDRVAVMYAGQIVEECASEDLFSRPQHPYTSGLLTSMPQNANGSGRLSSIPGVVPSPLQTATGCRFAPRCRWAETECSDASIPLLTALSSAVRCRRADDIDVGGVPW